MGAISPLAWAAVVWPTPSVHAGCPVPRHAWTLPIGGSDITTDAEGNVIRAGCFGRTVDFDPSKGVDERTSFTSNRCDIYVSKLGPDGSYAWTYTAGAEESDSAGSVVVDAEGNVFVSGSFQRSVDFDPGPARDLRHALFTSVNAFLLKLAPDGTYCWVRAFQSGASVYGYAVALHPTGDIIMVGDFFNSRDFDPGSATDTHFSEGRWDAYVTRFDSDGGYLETLTFGGGGDDTAENVAIDAEGNLFIAGEFRATADFDPGPGVDLHTALNRPIDRDVFLTKLGPDGSYRWTRTWPVEFGDGMAVTADGGAVITGQFVGTADFDPTAGVDLRTPFPSDDETQRGDAFITKINADGSYGWTNLIAGPSQEIGASVTVDPGGEIITIGTFQNVEALDFDAGPGRAMRSCNDPVNPSACDYLLRLREDGSFVSVMTTTFGWANRYRAITTDAWGNILYQVRIDIDSGVVDVDPTCGVHVAAYEPNGVISFVTKLICSDLAGDFDGNGMVDLYDVARLQTCFDSQGSRSCDPGCEVFDLAPATGGITDSDFSALLPLLTGPLP